MRLFSVLGQQRLLFLQSKATVESEDEEAMEVDPKPKCKSPTKTKVAKKAATPPSDDMDVDPDVSEPQEANEDSDEAPKKSKKVREIWNTRVELKSV